MNEGDDGAEVGTAMFASWSRADPIENRPDQLPSQTLGPVCMECGHGASRVAFLQPHRRPRHPGSGLLCSCRRRPRMRPDLHIPQSPRIRARCFCTCAFTISSPNSTPTPPFPCVPSDSRLGSQDQRGSRTSLFCFCLLPTQVVCQRSSFTPLHASAAL